MRRCGEKPDDREEEGRESQKMQNPFKKSEAEVSEHIFTDVTHRSWCRHCVRGSGRQMPHRKLEDEAGMPEVHADFGLVLLG